MLPAKIKILMKAWLPVVLWMGVIFVFSNEANSGAITETYLGNYNIPIRKLAHVLEYAVLFFLVQRALFSTGVLGAGLRLPLAMLIACLYALSDEWHQSFIPGRSACLADVGVDMLGALLALILQKLATAVNYEKQ